MKKRIVLIIFILVAIVAAAFAALKIYMAHELNKRSDADGNSEQYNVENLEKNADSVLAGKTILFLGSSVTDGAAADGQSFVELFEYLDSVKAIKEAKSGTTLVDKTSVVSLIAFGNGDSYIKRLKKIDPNQNVDCVVCQLSTNDATNKLPLGEISQSSELTAFDTQTITGALEYVICYSKETWNCPVVFYTGAYYDSSEYAEMVQRLYELREKWNIGIIDLYTDEEFNAIGSEEYNLYMYDPIHPTKAGYIQWWMPKMEQDLISILTQNA